SGRPESRICSITDTLLPARAASAPPAPDRAAGPASPPPARAPAPAEAKALPSGLPRRLRGRWHLRPPRACPPDPRRPARPPAPRRGGARRASRRLPRFRALPGLAPGWPPARPARQVARGQARMQPAVARPSRRSEEHTSELQSRFDLVCRLLLEKKKKYEKNTSIKHKKHNF